MSDLRDFMSDFVQIFLKPMWHNGISKGKASRFPRIR